MKLGLAKLGSPSANHLVVVVGGGGGESPPVLGRVGSRGRCSTYLAEADLPAFLRFPPAEKQPRLAGATPGFDALQGTST